MPAIHRLHPKWHSVAGCEVRGQGVDTHLDGHIHGLWHRFGYTQGAWYHRELEGRSLTRHSGRLIHQNLVKQQVKQNPSWVWDEHTHNYITQRHTHTPFFKKNWLAVLEENGGAPFIKKYFYLIKVELVTKSSILTCSKLYVYEYMSHFYMYFIHFINKRSKDHLFGQNRRFLLKIQIFFFFLFFFG